LLSEPHSQIPALLGLSPVCPFTLSSR